MSIINPIYKKGELITIKQVVNNPNEFLGQLLKAANHILKVYKESKDVGIIARGTLSNPLNAHTWEFYLWPNADIAKSKIEDMIKNLLGTFQKPNISKNTIDSIKEKISPSITSSIDYIGKNIVEPLEKPAQTYMDFMKYLKWVVPLVAIAIILHYGSDIIHTFKSVAKD